MRPRHPLLALLVVLLMLLAGCGAADEQATDEPDEQDEPGLAEAAELNVAGADRIEVREGGRAWPSNGRPESWDDAEVVADLTDPDEVAALTDALGQARHIDLGNVSIELVSPDYQVGFLRDDELLERLGYYQDVAAWGEHGIDGRWVNDFWEPLAVTDELPVELD